MLTHIREILMEDSQAILNQAWDEIGLLVASWNGQLLSGENKSTHRDCLFIEIGNEYSCRWAFHHVDVIFTLLNSNRFRKLLEVIRTISPDFIINIEPRHSVD
jgi:hypothetical protein